MASRLDLVRRRRAARAVAGEAPGGVAVSPFAQWCAVLLLVGVLAGLIYAGFKVRQPGDDDDRDY